MTVYDVPTVTELYGYDESELIEAMQRCADNHGECSVRTFADDEYPPVAAVSLNFGTWWRGKRAAGLLDTKRDKR